MDLTAADIATRAGGQVVCGNPDAIARSWAFDSRVLEPGSCFVALRGARDGHEFVDTAFAEGASVAIVHRIPEDRDHLGDGAIVYVDDPLAALQRVAQSVREERAALHVVAVAGSTGKTSTKDLLAGALRDVGVYANAESHNNEFGLPITLLNAPADVAAVITEMGERHAGDVARLCEIAAPSTGVVTNVGLAHAEFLGGLDGAARAMAELVDALPASGTLVLDADDLSTPALAARSSATVVTVGDGTNATLRISSLALDDELHPSFELAGQSFHIGVRGAHQARNAALAAGVAHVAFGLPLDAVAARLRETVASKWRMELKRRSDGLIVLNDAYNANPTSMAAALRALAALPVEGKRVAVLGDMRELGTYSDDAHADVGRLVAELPIDVVIGVGVGGGAIVDAVDDGSRTTRKVDKAAEALHQLRAMVGPHDAVLVKASRALRLETVAAGLLARGAPPPAASSVSGVGDRPPAVPYRPGGPRS